MNVNEFIKQEVVNQGFERFSWPWEQRVFWMNEAWKYATEIAKIRGYPIIEDIIVIAKMIEREFNMHGFRKINVTKQGLEQIGVNWENIYHLIPNLVMNGGDLTPEEWYKEFEEIHPFEDGNGRTGKVLFNWLKGTLDDPIFPPDFFGNGVP